MTILKLSDAFRFARQCGEHHSMNFAPVLFWRFTFDTETEL